LWIESTKAWTESIHKTLPGVITTLDEIFRYNGELKTFNALNTRIGEIIQFFTYRYRAVLYESYHIIGDIIGNFRFFEGWEKYGKWWTEYVEWTKSVVATLEEKFEVFRDVCNFISKSLQNIKQCIKAFKDSVTETCRKIEGLIPPEVLNVLQDWKRALLKMLAAYYEYEATQNYLEDDFSVRNARARIDDFLEMSYQFKIELDRENGELEAVVPLLLPANTIRQLRLPNFDKLRRKERPYSLPYQDFYELFMPLYQNRIIPPFDGTGVVIGSQDYISFDGRLYQFAGTCEYLLAQDAIDGNFSVVVSYSDSYELIITSLFVVMGDDTVEIKSDYKVLLHNLEREVPFYYWGINVTREGDNVVVTTDNGLTVYANPKHDIYIVNVNGYYLGKTQGLLGIYDNEPMDDLFRSDGVFLDTSLKEFVRSWDVSTDCRDEVNLAFSKREARYRSPAYDYCAKYFKNKSAKYAEAFGEVDPKPYMELCLQDFGKSPLEGKPNIHFCYTAAAYTTVAQLRGYDIEVPTTCKNLLNYEKSS